MVGKVFIECSPTDVQAFRAVKFIQQLADDLNFMGSVFYTPCIVLHTIYTLYTYGQYM